MEIFKRNTLDKKRLIWEILYKEKYGKYPSWIRFKLFLIGDFFRYGGFFIILIYLLLMLSVILLYKRIVYGC
jgi:hypothetical protein